MMSKNQKPNFTQAQQQLVTVIDWVRWATSQFEAHKLYYGHGTENAWDEAVALVLGGLHISHDTDSAILQAKLIEDEKAHLVMLLRQRIEDRIPLPYLLKEAWFMGLPFYVDQHVLIPRSPFAEWIESGFEPWVDSSLVASILEIGTGSGCMAIGAAKAFPGAVIDAVDISPEALAVAKRNVARHEVEDQVTLIESDCFKGLADQRYDVIMSNPPYVGHEEMASLPPEYLHEPRGALEADEDGLKIALEIIANANRHLNPGGILMMEVGNSMPVLAQRLPEVSFTWLEQEHGGHGIFVLRKDQLDKMSV